MISVRLERLASNQVVFREVNERLLELLDASPGTTEFVCECSNPECTDAVSLTLLEYERVRSRSNQFVIVPGHEIPEIEQVTLASDGYFLIRKLYGAAYAEQTDPRSRGETLPVLCSRPSASVPATPPARKEASRG